MVWTSLVCQWRGQLLSKLNRGFQILEGQFLDCLCFDNRMTMNTAYL